MTNYQRLSYEDLILSKNGTKLFYIELLNTIEWTQKREIIINRDARKCTTCNRYPSINNSGNYYKKLSEEDKASLLANYKLDTQKSKEQILTSFSKVAPERGLSAVEKLFKQGVEEDNLEKIADSLDNWYVPCEIPLYLHVHHTYYIQNKLPWEYANESLITKCSECHTKIHKEEKILVYRDESKTHIMDFTPCTRCDGSGYLEQFSYYLGGVCFQCGGSKYMELVGYYETPKFK